jgi:hypothetical protein
MDPESHVPVLVPTQPWKEFLEEPEIRPFIDAAKGELGSIRLKTEKDEHGLGG